MVFRWSCDFPGTPEEPVQCLWWRVSAQGMLRAGGMAASGPAKALWLWVDLRHDRLCSSCLLFRFGLPSSAVHGCLALPSPVLA